MESLEGETLKIGFWDDKTHADNLFAKLTGLKEVLHPWRDLIESINELSELLELYDGDGDSSLAQEVEHQIDALLKVFDALRLKILLAGKHDRDDCFLT
ncbi:MAG: PCRF domain-containing protein, partial [Sphaerochaetaceae bacterium]